jgi:hypothetical protein
MIPAGYMAKRIYKRPDWLKAPKVIDIYSVSACQSENFADYIPFWKHNGFWFFDSPEIIESVARERNIPLGGTSLFYYEVYQEQFDGERWMPFSPEPSFTTSVTQSSERQLEGFDVTTYYAGTNPECSPLSCNGLAESVSTNEHCLLTSFGQAQEAVSRGVFNDAEPGPYRIFAVYSVTWPVTS